MGRAILMNDVLKIARLNIALQRAFLGQAILIFTSVLMMALLALPELIQVLTVFEVGPAVTRLRHGALH